MQFSEEETTECQKASQKMRRADIRFNSAVGCGGTGLQGGAQADPDGLKHAGVCPVGFTRLDVVASEHGLVTCMKGTTSRWLGAARGVEGGRAHSLPICKAGFAAWASWAKGRAVASIGTMVLQEEG
jgi:hypothetical protein